jgi:glutamyl-Q tRNA(Asp) synthetase
VLEALDLEWDGPVLYQSTRLQQYLDTALSLAASGQAYYCSCSRQLVRSLTGGARYPGTCRDRALGPGDTALRFRIEEARITFVDRLRGKVQRDILATDGDFVIVRRDGLPAYHLAVVLDDAEQGISDVVRGVDLLDSTPLHMALQRRLGVATPQYWHIPLITDAAGEKLSKRAGAAPVDASRPDRAAAAALELLGLSIPGELKGAPPTALWQWAKQHWRIESLV